MISSTVISAGGSTNMEKNPEAVATAMEFEEKEAMWARILAKMEELSSALDRVLGSPSASSTRINAAASSPLPATTEGTCSESDATPMPMAPTKSSTLGIQFPAAVGVESTSVIAASVPATPLLLADQVVVHDAIQVENNLAAIMPTKCSTIGLSVNADQQLSEFIREATPCASPTAVVLDGDLKHDADPFSNEDYHGVLTHVGGMSLFLELGFNSAADKFGEQPFKDMTWDVELADTHDNGVSLFRDLVLASTQPCCRSVFISGFKEKLQMMKNDGELCEQWDPGILLEKTFRLAGAVFPNDNGDAQIEYLMHILSAVILWIEPPNVIAESIRSGGSETVKSVLDNQNEEETWGSDALEILLETWNVILGEADADRSPVSADGALAASSLFKIIVESQLKAAADSAFEDGVDAKYFHVSVSKHDEQLTLYALIARTASDTTIPFLEQLFSVQFARLSQTDVGHDPTRTLEELYWLLLITSHVLTDSGERETLLIPEALHGGFPNVVDSSLVDGSIAKSQELFECFNWQHPIVVAVHDVDRTKRLFVGSKFQILEAIGGERPAPWPSWRYYWCGELLEFQSNDNIHDHWQNTKVLRVLPEHLLPLQQPQRRDLLAVCKLQDVWIPIMHIMPCIEVWDGHVQWDPGELLSTMNGEQEPKHTERSWRMQSIGARGYRLIIGMNDSPTPWDPGAVLYIKKEFSLESQPLIEGLIVAMSLIGATVITTFSGAVADSVGRRPLLIASAILYFLSGLIMLWAPNVYVLLLARLIDGFGIGLSVTLVPLYISETAPTDIRGLLNTLPQFSGSGGMFLSYCMVFTMSLMPQPDWRIMLGVLSIPSLVYFALTVFYLPESPRWLVSKGRMAEAKRVLQRLRGREDVSGEMALLVEGLGVGKDTHFEEYIVGPDDELADDGLAPDPDKMKLYGPEEGLSWIARPVRGGGQSALGSALGLVSRNGSMVSQGKSLVDPLVTLFGSVHEKMPEVMGSMRSTLFPNFGSMFSVAEQQQAKADWDAEIHGDDEDYASDHGADDIEDSLHSPLMSRQATSVEGKEIAAPHGSIMGAVGRSISMQGGDSVSSMGIGGGWQLAWKWTEREGADGQKEGGFQRIYLHEEGVQGDRRGSILSMPGGDVPPGGEYIQAAALVSQPALYSKDLIGQQLAGPAMVHPSEAAAKGSKWADLFEPGVKHALFVGIGLQILQQFAGINGVLYYTPQILEQAGVGILLSNIGLSSLSASILISALTTLLMLPSIGIAMRLMDMSGRRFLLLSTIPVLIVALAVLVLVNILDVGTMVHAALSTISVIVYFCFFVMGFGPIPNILCAEIFPTSVRGICIAICALTFWIGDIIVTYTLPVMLNAIGLAGVFGIYALVCILALVFVYMKVPETKGMPLEVITEFFSVGAKQGKEATD